MWFIWFCNDFLFENSAFFHVYFKVDGCQFAAIDCHLSEEGDNIFIVLMGESETEITKVSLFLLNLRDNNSYVTLTLASYRWNSSLSHLHKILLSKRTVNRRRTKKKGQFQAERRRERRLHSKEKGKIEWEEKSGLKNRCSHRSIF